MARKPNYRFARLERERNKAARKAARAKLKAERAELRRQEKAGQTLSAWERLPSDAVTRWPTATRFP